MNEWVCGIVEDGDVESRGVINILDTPEYYVSSMILV